MVTRPEDSKQGRCLCGAVRYAIRGPIGPLGHCHCRTCRKSHAAAFATTARVAWRDFEWTQGDEFLRAHESSPGKKRLFCGECGSPMCAAWDDDEELILRLGSLTDDPVTRPVVHIWAADKAPWYEIKTALPVLPRGIRKRPSDSDT